LAASPAVDRSRKIVDCVNIDSDASSAESKTAVRKVIVQILDRMKAAFFRHGAVILLLGGLGATLHFALGKTPENVAATAGTVEIIGRAIDGWVLDGSPRAQRIAAVVLAVLAAAAVQVAGYRLTGNRTVAAVAAAFLIAHPAAVAATSSQTALVDGVALFLVAAALALHAKPRFRSPRFPNLLPSAFTWPVFFLVVAAFLTSADTWPLPFALVLVDGLFDRDRGGAPFERRRWPYVPYFAVSAAGLLTALLRSSSATTSAMPEGFGRRLVALIAPAFGFAAPKWIVVIVIFGVVVGWLALLLDLSTDIGRRRTLIRWFALAAAWSSIFVFAAWIVPARLASQGVAIAVIGVSFALSALVWRLTSAVHRGSETMPSTAGLSTSIVSDALRPLPNLAATPAPRPIVVTHTTPPRPPVAADASRVAAVVAAQQSPLLLSPALQTALSHLGRSLHESSKDAFANDEKNFLFAPLRRAFDEDPYLVQEIIPSIPVGSHILELTHEGSRYTSALATRARRFTVVAAERETPSLHALLANVAGAALTSWTPGKRLPVAANDVDFVFSTTSLRVWPNIVIAVFLRELERVMHPGARGAIGMMRMPDDFSAALSQDAAVNPRENAVHPDMARVLFERARLRVLEMRDVRNGEFLVVFEKRTGDA
jgi:hypothetical protein